MSTMSNRVISISAPKGVIPTVATAAANMRESLSAIGSFFHRCAMGMEPGAVGETFIALQEGSTDAALAAASGTITISGGSGTVGARIGGQLITVTWATSDTNTAALLAAAINADATLSKVVSATSALGVVTVTALKKGVEGNFIATVLQGTGVTVSGTALTGGVGGGGTPATIQF